MIPLVSHFSGTNDASIHWNIAWPAQPERFTNIKQLKIQDTSDTYKIYFVGITNKFCKNNKYILSVFCLHMKCILSQQILPCCSRKAVDPEKQRAEHLKNILNEITC